MSRATLGAVSPGFIVEDLGRSVEHYVERLGFELRYQAPDDDPVFAIVGRDGAQILLKHVSESVPALPNRARHEWAPWDGFVHVGDPDRLAREFHEGGVELAGSLERRDDGLFGFEVRDPDGYTLFFGRQV